MMPEESMLVEADHHAHHLAGLNSPDFWLPETGAYGKWGRMQRELWNARMEILERIGPVDIYALNGDAFDGRGEKSGGTELLPDASWTNQVENAEGNVRVVQFKGKPRRIFLRGCLAPGHRILTHDLRWVPVETLRPGDLLVGFDACPPDPLDEHIKRKWHQSVVTSNELSEEETCIIRLSDGTTLTCTWDHPFLIQPRPGMHYGWYTAADIKRMIEQEVDGRRRDTRVFMQRALPVWNEDLSWEAGYLAGFFDGEGTFSYGKRSRSDRGTEEFTMHLAATQKDNVALAMAQECIETLRKRTGTTGWSSLTSKSGRVAFDDSCLNLAINGGRQGKLAFLGIVRPRRPLEKVDWEKIGGVFKCRERDEVCVESVVDAGRQTICGLGTSTNTYVSDGFLSHNTPYHVGWDADYENILARNLKGKIKDHAFFQVGGVVFDLKHHLGSSSIPHGRATPLMREHLWNLLWAEHQEQPKADVIIRSHVHYYTVVAGDGWMAMSTAAMQAAATKFGGRRCSGTVNWGMTVFRCEGGEYSWKTYLVHLEANKVGLTIV